MQRGLVDDRSGQHGRAIFLTLYGQAPEPVRPAVVEVALYPNLIERLLAQVTPPFGHGSGSTETLLLQGQGSLVCVYLLASNDRVKCRVELRPLLDLPPSSEVAIEKEDWLAT